MDWIVEVNRYKQARIVVEEAGKVTVTGSWYNPGTTCIVKDLSGTEARELVWLDGAPTLAYPSGRYCTHEQRYV